MLPAIREVLLRQNVSTYTTQQEVDERLRNLHCLPDSLSNTTNTTRGAGIIVTHW